MISERNLLIILATGMGIAIHVFSLTCGIQLGEYREAQRRDSECRDRFLEQKMDEHWRPAGTVRIEGEETQER